MLAADSACTFITQVKDKEKTPKKAIRGLHQ